jgi:hypothetical protein
MLGRLFRRRPPSTFSSSFFRPHAFPRHSSPFREFATGSRQHQRHTKHQRYRYSRFNDPNHSSGQNYFQSLWSRFTPGQKIVVVGLGGGAPAFYVTHLETVEPTGRRRFIFMSRNMEEQLGKQVSTQ